MTNGDDARMAEPMPVGDDPLDDFEFGPDTADDESSAVGLDIVPDGGENPPAEEPEIKDAVADDVPAAESGLSDELVGRAKAAGLYESDWQGLESAALERIVGVLERQSTQHAGSDGEETAGVEPPAAEPDPLDAWTLDPEEYDEKIVDTVSGIKEYAKAQRDQLKEMQVRQAITETDNIVLGLGEQVNDLFGEGSLHDLEDNNQFQNRVKLMQEFDRQLAGFLARKETPPSRKAVALRAYRAAFPEHSTKAERAALVGKVDQRKGSMTMRPGNRANGQDERSARERVAELEQKYLRDNGTPTEPVNEALSDFDFPD